MQTWFERGLATLNMVEQKQQFGFVASDRSDSAGKAACTATRESRLKKLRSAGSCSRCARIRQPIAAPTVEFRFCLSIETVLENRYRFRDV